MNKAALKVATPAAVVFLIAFLAVTWDRGAPPGCRPPARDIEFSAIQANSHGVRVKGTAHYPVLLALTVGEGESARRERVFPLFEPGDLQGREIRVLVRTTYEPDPLLGFEDMTVEGLVRKPGEEIPESMISALKAKGYTFAPGWVVIERYEP